MNASDDTPNNRLENDEEVNQPSSSASNDPQRSSDPQEGNGRPTSNYIARICRNMLSVVPDEARQQYAKAMLMSIKLGDSSRALPCSPRQILRECLFRPEIQSKYKILLNKASAIQFLSEFCGASISESSFNRRYTVQSYEHKFHRKATKVGKRRLLCTYAEWLYMFDYPFEPNFPRDLESFLPDGWEPPAGVEDEDFS